jgi:hypothetical protein
LAPEKEKDREELMNEYIDKPGNLHGRYSGGREILQSDNTQTYQKFK